MPTLHGLDNCDTCRKARNWLKRFGIAHAFVDVRANVPSPERLRAWKEGVGGWDALVNRASTTWRNLPPDRRTPGSDAEWSLLLREHPALIKRPLAELDDGRVVQGFSDNAYKALFGVEK